MFVLIWVFLTVCPWVPITCSLWKLKNVIYEAGCSEEYDSDSETDSESDSDSDSEKMAEVEEPSVPPRAVVRNTKIPEGSYSERLMLLEG